MTSSRGAFCYDESVKETTLKQVKNWLKRELGETGAVSFAENLNFGDIATNVALSQSNPQKAARDFVEKLSANKPDFISEISIAGPGFINFSLSDEFLISSAKTKPFDISKGLEKVIVEYTDPNPFKEFHIGHLMSNAIGEAIAGLIEATGMEVKRACYQGDVGMHAAKALWKGDYALGAKAFDEDERAKVEIQEINKKIYNQSDPELNSRYQEGKKKSLEEFEKIYKKLGTKFDYFFFESESGPIGLEIVKKNVGKVFTESDEAVIYEGKERDLKLHTRVFITKEGLPTYEAKELGLFKLKSQKFNYDKSVVITGNEVNDYFKVVLKAAEEVLPELSGKTFHISHGMMRLPSGKMSSRRGDVVTAEFLINEVKQAALKVMEKSGRAGIDKNLAEKVAVGAIKFSILRQHPGKDIIFDINKSISFEGDSGPYLMYTHARANSLLEKGKEERIELEKAKQIFGAKNLLRLLSRFEDTVSRAAEEYSPNFLVEYLLEICGAFNSWYASEQMITEDKNASAQKLAIVKIFQEILARGLHILAIAAPERM